MGIHKEGKMKYYIAFDIGCIERGEPSKLIGIYNSYEKANDACAKARKIQQKSWTGQHAFDVFEWDGEVNKGEYEISDKTNARLYRRKFGLIEAMQYDGANSEDIAMWIHESVYTWRINKDQLYIKFYHDVCYELLVSIGDWLVKDAAGVFSVCDEDVFRVTFEKVN